jgi:hypothetical protein
MNPLNLFKFLEKEKGRPIPFEVKLVNGLPLTPEELDVKGNLMLYNSKISSLPQGLKIEGFFDLENMPIKSFPSNLQVGNFLDIRGTKIDSLPPDLKVGGNFYIKDTPLAEKSYEEIRAMLTTGYIKGNIYNF